MKTVIKLKLERRLIEHISNKEEYMNNSYKSVRKRPAKQPSLANALLLKCHFWRSSSRVGRERGGEEEERTIERKRERSKSHRGRANHLVMDDWQRWGTGKMPTWSVRTGPP